MPDVVLINPAWPGRVSRLGGRHNRAWPPLDLLNCAAILRAQGLSVDLMDLRARPLPWAKVQARARAAGLALMTSSPLDRWQCPNLELDWFLDLARSLGHPHLVLSGAHGTLMPQRVLAGSGAWAVILGEPEPALPGLAAGRPRREVPGLAYLEGGALAFGPPRQALDLAGLPLPALDLAPPEHYHYEPLGRRLALLETGRGCRQACAFCLKAMYGPGLRVKRPAQVLAEAAQAARLGVKSLYFIDLDFAADPALALAICQGLRQAGPDLRWCCQARADNLGPELMEAMARAGCGLIHLGVESAAPEVLGAVAKGQDLGQVARVAGQARRLGMELACFFLFGLPGESPHQRRQAAALARRLGATYCSFHGVTPYPGTPLQQRLGGDVFAPSLAAPADPALGRDLRRAYLSFYLAPATLWRLGRGPGSLLKGLRLLGGFLGRGG